MRYRDLKDERDAAVARAIEAERLSMKSEFDRVTKEFKEEEARLITQVAEKVLHAYRQGFTHGLEEAARTISAVAVQHRKQESSAPLYTPRKD